MSAELSVRTAERIEVIDLTDRIAAAVPDHADGVVTAYVKHTTCALIINEAEPRLLEDFETFLDDLVPDSGWAHDDIDDNADSHLRAALLGPSATIPVVDGELQLGTWQSVLLVECDGPRTRTVSVTTR